MSDRCTVWVKTKKEDWTKALALIKEDSGATPFEDIEDERDGWEEWMFEDVRYPDDLLGCLEKAGIPYRSVNSAGEYPEAVCVCLPGEISRCAPMMDGDMIVPVNWVTGEPSCLDNVKELIRLEKKFYNYCKTGELK